MTPDLDAMDDLEESYDTGGMAMLGRALACLIAVAVLAPLIAWLAA